VLRPIPNENKYMHIATTVKGPLSIANPNPIVKSEIPTSVVDVSSVGRRPFLSMIV